MKKLHLWGFICFALCCVYQSDAQEELTKEICDQKAELILQAKNYLPLLPEQDINDMIEFIAPCADLNYSRTSPKSAYAKGLLHFQNGDFGYVHNRYHELSAVYLFRARYYGYKPGILTDIINDLSYSYIKPTPMLSHSYSNVITDLNILLDANYKTDIVHYLLGYIKLKNFTGTTTFASDALAQEAKTHFETSTHPMAKHWLAIIHYFGYGVPRDTAKGLQMLQNNDILNSQTLFQQLQHQDFDWLPVSAQERLILLEDIHNLPKATTILNDAETTYQGHFIEFDWMDKGIKRRIPVRLTLETIEDLSETQKKVSYTFKMNGTERERAGFINDAGSYTYFGFQSNFDFHEFEFPLLENLLQDHPEKETVSYLTTGMKLYQTTIDNRLALIAVPGSHTRFKDSGEYIDVPLRMVLYPEQTASTSLAAENSLTDTNSSASLELDKNFATIAPNPIGDQFTITYTLDQEAEVQVGIYDFFGQQRLQVPTQRSSAGATHTITVNSASLASGTYVVQMTVNGAPYSKMIIKE